jgi:hypothetical protein
MFQAAAHGEETCGKPWRPGISSPLVFAVTDALNARAESADIPPSLARERRGRYKPRDLWRFPL